MQDPKPENITGSKAHTVHWNVEVGHVALATVALVIVVVVSTKLSDDDEDEVVL